MPKDTESWNQAKVVAMSVMKQQVPNPVGDATHFHTAAVKPAWSRKFKRVHRIGNHIFYVNRV